MKRNVLQVRLKDNELKMIRDLAEDEKITVSEWVRRKILVDTAFPVITEKMISKVVKVLPEYTPSVVGIYNKCQSPGCPSNDAKAYQRATGTFYLCDTHKP